MVSTTQPLSMIPAEPGWRAIWANGTGWSEAPIVGWAVTEAVAETEYGEISPDTNHPGWRPTSVEAVTIDPELGPVVGEPTAANSTLYVAPDDDLPDDAYSAELWANHQAHLQRLRDQAAEAQQVKAEQAAERASLRERQRSNRERDGFAGPSSSTTVTTADFTNYGRDALRPPLGAPPRDAA